MGPATVDVTLPRGGVRRRVTVTAADKSLGRLGLSLGRPGQVRRCRSRRRHLEQDSGGPGRATVTVERSDGGQIKTAAIESCASP